MPSWYPRRPGRLACPHAGREDAADAEGGRQVRVTLHRHGGFAAIPGLGVRVCLDSATLGAQDAAELAEAVRQAELDRLVPVPVRPDARIYELAVEDGSAAAVRAQVSDLLPSTQVRELIDLLLSRGSPMP
jgi:hypothetical protein